VSALHPKVAGVLGASEHTVHDHARFDRAITSPADFAEALRYPLDRITKSVFLSPQSAAQPDARYAVAVCGMGRKLDFAAVSAALDARGRMQVATPEQLGAVLGYPRNGVSPLGAPQGVAVLIDSAVLDHDTVLVGGGAVGIEVEIAPGLLVALCSARVAAITKAAG
jgi:Cys-tRNA(Pro)/Cys-tRNA(Cys) deacylase